MKVGRTAKTEPATVTVVITLEGVPQRRLDRFKKTLQEHITRYGRKMTVDAKEK